MEQFADYAYYYNAFYKDKDYKCEAEDVDYILKNYGKNIEKIIVFGSGTGMHDGELVRLGYKCHGIDMSPQMIKAAIERAKKNKIPVEYEVADIREYNPHEQYDAVVSLFHVISYQNSNDDLRNTFKSARKALKDGGIFLFDAWYGPGVLSDPPSVRIKEVDENENRLIRLCRPDIHFDSNIVDVNYEVLVINKETSITKVIKETHSMRYLFKPEIEELLSQTGFKLIANIDCKTLKKTDDNSWTCYFVAEAL